MLSESKLHSIISTPKLWSSILSLIYRKFYSTPVLHAIRYHIYKCGRYYYGPQFSVACNILHQGMKFVETTAGFKCQRISNMPLTSTVIFSAIQYFKKQCSATNIRQAPAVFQLICFVLLQRQHGLVMPVIPSPTVLSLSGQFHVHAADAARSNTEMQLNAPQTSSQ